MVLLQLNYARNYLPQLLPRVHGRVVYLDTDIIVLGWFWSIYLRHDCTCVITQCQQLVTSNCTGDVYELAGVAMGEGHLIAVSSDCDPFFAQNNVPEVKPDRIHPIQHHVLG